MQKSIGQLPLGCIDYWANKAELVSGINSNNDDYLPNNFAWKIYDADDVAYDNNFYNYKDLTLENLMSSFVTFIINNHDKGYKIKENHIFTIGNTDLSNKNIDFIMQYACFNEIVYFY